MPNIATSVRLNEDAIRVLANLSAKLARPKAQVVELALRELEERTFWVDVQRAFEEAAGDPAECARQKAEIETWESGTAKDFHGEAW